ncbi:MAG TPA: 30S ribosomal protein S4 [Longimicrobiales bacterium]|nr:30S ribosomal protein S4 [Longimicrobiales bacterium]
MGRYTGPVCKLCRREGQKLFLKGTKCFTEKCPIERRNYAPGQHGLAQARRRKSSDYAQQLREKQKVKRIYGVGERYFKTLFERAAKHTGVTGENLLIALEQRLDNVVYRLGFASSRNQARQLVRHRHVEVNGRVVDIPSYQVRPGDEIRLRAASRDLLPVQASIESKSRPEIVRWLAVDEATRTGRMLERPTRADIPLAVQEQLIVELYSK